MTPCFWCRAERPCLRCNTACQVRSNEPLPWKCAGGDWRHRIFVGLEVRVSSSLHLSIWSMPWLWFYRRRWRLLRNHRFLSCTDDVPNGSKWQFNVMDEQSERTTEDSHGLATLTLEHLTDCAEAWGTSCGFAHSATFLQALRASALAKPHAEGPKCTKRATGCLLLSAAGRVAGPQTLGLNPTRRCRTWPNPTSERHCPQ